MRDRKSEDFSSNSTKTDLIPILQRQAKQDFNIYYLSVKQLFSKFTASYDNNIHAFSS